jgi:hypothetical protein
MTRKERFLVALSRSGFRSANEYARSVGVSRTHLMLVLDGPRESATLDAKIDAFIAEHVGAESTDALVG